MKSILRNLVMASAVMAVAALASHTAQAEETRVKVPFSFTVSGEICPAGDYIVTHDASRNLVTLQNRKSSQRFTWVMSPGDISSTSNKVTLRFDPHGQFHALESIHYGNMTREGLDKPVLEAGHDATRISQGR